ncbi:MAG: hypothetical protein ACI9ON_001122 [Limisphaerales bacterium]|jgi:hypothetical protein
MILARSEFLINHQNLVVSHLQWGRHNYNGAMAIVNLGKIFGLIWFAGLGLSPALSHAHGGVVLEDDLCLINIGFYQAHFTLFQPQRSGHAQFCEYLPELGETIIVLEYLHDGLQDLPVDLRIIQNVTGMGQFTARSDIIAIEDIENVTVFYHPPTTDPDVFSALYNFSQSGEYVGIVTAIDEVNGAEYWAVFPFEVNIEGFGDTAVIGLLIVTAALLAMLVRWWATQTQSSPATLKLALLVCTCLPFASPQLRAETVTATGKLFQISVASALQPISINRMHEWTVLVTDQKNQPVIQASIEITGGMPLHNHGLPSIPRMTQELGAGQYLIEGMKFHMRGLWLIEVTITHDQQREVLTLNLEL